MYDDCVSGISDAEARLSGAQTPVPILGNVPVEGSDKPEMVSAAKEIGGHGEMLG